MNHGKANKQPTLVICEGSAECVIFNCLLEGNKLTIPSQNLVRDSLTDRPYVTCRSARKIEASFLNVSYEPERLKIIRIIDSRNELFHLSSPYKEMVDVENIFTRPEIEILAILKEGAYNQWKNGRSMKPSEFCKERLGLHDIKKRDFLKEYWQNPDSLCHVIMEYERKHKFKADEHCLASLLNNSARML